MQNLLTLFVLSDNNYSDSSYPNPVRDWPAANDQRVFLNRRGAMIFVAHLMVFIVLSLSLTTSGLAAPSEEQSAAAAQDTLRQYVEELKQNPANTALREKIILLALSMKPAPIVPEDAERNVAQGTSLIKEAADAGGYNKAIVEFEAAANSAPWLAIAYFNLGVIQEKVGFYTEAIQNFRFYLMAAPGVINTNYVKDKISELEAEVEKLHASSEVVTPASSAAEPLPVPVPVPAPKMTLAIEPEKQPVIIKTPPAVNKSSVPVEKKHKVPSFIGNWFFKDTVRGEERTIQAFGIGTDTNGNIVPTAPTRAADYVPVIRAFEISNTNMKIEIHWRLTTVVGYWKIESYNLTLSEDGTQLTGSCREKSVGGRNIEHNRTLFRL